MKIIARGRNSGKTTELIIESAKTGRYILVPNRMQARYIMEMAHKMKLQIPYPMTVSNMEYKSIGKNIEEKGILVDNAEQVLQQLINADIHMMTLTNKEERPK